MTWNVEAFRECINNRGLPTDNIEQLINSLDVMIKRFGYHSELTKRIWNAFFGTNDYRVATTAAARTEFETESNFLASLQAIHPIADIMAQIINASVLNDRIAIHNVALHRITAELTQTQGTQNIQAAIHELLDSLEFKFLDSFVNTLKHRNLIETEHYGEFGTNTENRIGLRTTEFTFRQVTYPSIWIEDFIDDYVPVIIDKAMEIGNRINDYLL